MRDVGHVHQEVVEPLLHLIELRLQGLQLVGLGIDLGHQLRGVFLLGFERADLFRQRVAPGLQVLRFRLYGFAFRFQRRKLRRVQHEAAIGQPRSDCLHIGSQCLYVKHFRLKSRFFRR